MSTVILNKEFMVNIAVPYDGAHYFDARTKLKSVKGRVDCLILVYALNLQGLEILIVRGTILVWMICLYHFKE